MLEWYLVASLTVGGVTAEKALGKYERPGDCNKELKVVVKQLTDVELECIGQSTREITHASRPSWMTNEQAAKLIERQNKWKQR